MNSNVFDRLLARFAADERRPLLSIDGALPVEERWQRLRINYATFRALADAGLEDWMAADPYEIANWISLFTPIEAAAWHDIRAAGLPLWPQLPVGRYFLDFGNPVVKVALECDGRRWHPPGKDAARDAWLRSQGWTIYRVPGWRCMASTELPDEYDEATEEERAVMHERRNQQTMVGVIRAVKEHFIGALA